MHWPSHYDGTLHSSCAYIFGAIAVNLRIIGVHIPGIVCDRDKSETGGVLAAWGLRGRFYTSCIYIYCDVTLHSCYGYVCGTIAMKFNEHGNRKWE